MSELDELRARLAKLEADATNTADDPVRVWLRSLVDGADGRTSQVQIFDSLRPRRKDT